jgi:hypothetical protein
MTQPVAITFDDGRVHCDAEPRVLAIASDLDLAPDVTPSDWHASCTAAYITTSSSNRHELAR